MPDREINRRAQLMMTQNSQSGEETLSRMTPPPPPRMQKATFGVAWWAWVAFGVGGVVTLGEAYASKGDRSLEALTPYMMGLLVGMLLLAIIPAFIAFYLGKRSRKAATIVFILFAAIGTAGHWQMAQRRMAQDRAEKDFEREIEQSKEDIRRDIESGKLSASQGADRLDRLIASAGKASQTVGGDRAIAMQAMARTMSGLSDCARKYGAALDAVLKQSPMNPMWAKTREDFGQCRKNIAALREGCDAMRSQFNGMEGRIREELAKGGMSGSHADEIVREFTAKIDRAKPQFKAIRDEDDVMVGLLGQAADLLENNWDKWKIDSVSGQLMFEKVEAEKAFNGIAQKLHEAANRQENAQRDYIKLMQ
jgi:hypothetical protein